MAKKTTTKRMTKTTIIETLFKEMQDAGARLTKKDVSTLVTRMSVLAQKQLKAGYSFSLPHVGTLQVRELAARQGRNPATGEPMAIPARKKVALRTGKEMKDLLNH